MPNRHATGVTPSGSGSRPSGRASKAVSPVPASIPNAVGLPKAPDYCRPHEWLLLSSYCGDDNPNCTEQRPCSDCLAMCNVFDENGKFIRELGSRSDENGSRIINTLADALTHCEHYALRIANNPDGHQFDRDNAAGIVKVARIHVGALSDARGSAYEGDTPAVPVEPKGPELSPHPPLRWESALAETNRLQRELDITNADHIALWLEANTIPDETMSQCISWLACRIVEAHEAASAIEARRAETQGGSVGDESAGPKDDAQGGPA